MRKFLFFLLVTFAVIASLSKVQAQSLNPGWQIFHSQEYDFSLEYPEIWTVRETGRASFSFFRENAFLGVFRVSIKDDYFDSASVVRELFLQYNEIKGSKLDSLSGYWTLSYKTMIMNEGKNFDVYHWVFGYGARMYFVQYLIDTERKGFHEALDEVRIVFRMIETLNFGIE